MPYLKRNDASVFFDDTGGRGEAIVTLHGFIENGSYWGRTGVSGVLADQRAIDEKILSERIVPQIPVGRLGEPEEVARCVVFLAGDEAGFITGSTISANGGQYLA